MINEKTLEISGKQVRLRYCAATENGFEQIRKKSISELDIKSREDLISLAISAIIAAYARYNEESPLTSEDILFDCTPAEITSLIATTLELMNEWYRVPEVIKPEMEAEASDEPKNA